MDLAAAAERYCFADPVAALTRLRLLGETMALQTAAAVAALPNQERVVDFSTARGESKHQPPLAVFWPIVSSVSRHYRRRIGIRTAAAPCRYGSIQ